MLTAGEEIAAWKNSPLKNHKIKITNINLLLRMPIPLDQGLFKRELCKKNYEH